ncbi:hypothetical protein BC939DRAFT_28614 [Gamsiella multidivaricata]|uniref:uncharacterized protein n=1 Tax=Gamsiella multidivaricata TaxID=101098 RepID=UPI002220D65D|nr:uncharacterized protein BC939DRAFT_28614 [Gamsiella multidivaricata]KAI7816868.1 hypothetical protein BC939DRAFT_28614 [Gamsiella multidivaricata]
MVNSSANGLHLDDETRNQEIVTSLRGFLKHQTERVSLYKEFNDAFKEYTAKRMTSEEYATICNIVTQGFVELSIEILALEAHLGGPTHTSTINGSAPTPSSTTTLTATETSIESTPNRISLDSPEHAQLIRQVQLLEKQKLALTVQGQKWAMAKQEQEAEDEKEREAELQTDRVVSIETEEQGDEGVEAEVEATAVQGSDSHTQAVNGEGIKLSGEEWQAKLDGNRAR